MAIQKAAIAVPFAGGVETKQDPKQVPGAKLLDLQNAVFTRQTTLTKRNGYRALGRTVDGEPAVTIANPRGLAHRDDELLLFTDQRAYSYRPSQDTWSDSGDVSSVVASDMTIARDGAHQSMPDIAINAGVTLVGWEETSDLGIGVYYSALETASGRELIPPTQADVDGERPRCVACGGVLILLWANRNEGRLWSIVVNPLLPAPGTAQIVTDDLSMTYPSYDCDAIPTDTYDGKGYAVIAWGTDPSGYRVGYLHPSGVLGSPVTGLPPVATWTEHAQAIAVAMCKGDAVNPIAVVFAGPAGVEARIHNPADLTLRLGYSGGGSNPFAMSPAVPDWVRVACEWSYSSTASGDTRTLWWAGELAGATSDVESVYLGSIDYTTGAQGNLGLIHGHGLATRAFADGQAGAAGNATAGDIYVTLTHAVFFEPYYAAVRLSSMPFGDGVTFADGSALVVSARLLAGLATGLPASPYATGGGGRVVVIGTDSNTRYHLASVQAVDRDPANGLHATFTSRKHLLPLGYRIQLSSANKDQFSEQGFRAVTLDYAHPGAWQTAQLGKGLYLSGAMPLHYDGYRWAEPDFHSAPDTFNGTIVSSSTTGGSMTTSATYLYRLMYEEIDGQGELHPGPVTVGTTVVMGGAGADNAVILTLPTLRLTRKRSVQISVWRCPANQTGTIDQIPFYRVSANDVTKTGANGYVLNDPTTDSISFTDYLSDADLIAREPLYTNGGILSNEPSPWAGGVIAGGKSRLFWTDPSDPNLVRYSQEVRDDTAAEAPVDLSVRIDPYGGAVVGLAVMDDVVIVFKETAIYAFAGDGPAAAPALDPEVGFSPAQLITADCGCKSSDSIGLTPEGLIFQSDKGIMLLTRSQQIQRIGNPVYAYNGQTVTRSILLPDRPQIVMLAGDTDGRALLFDYERAQWSTFTNHVALDGAVVGGKFYYLRPDGRVFVETIGAYADDNAHIPMRIETAWLRMAGYLQGWHRFWHALFLGTYKSPHTLSVRFRIDYQEAWTPAFLLDVNADYDPSLYGVGIYGAGDYGGPGGPSTVYQRRIHIGKRAQAIAFRIEDVEATTDFGASFELSELLLTGGVTRADFPVGTSRSD